MLANRRSGWGKVPADRFTQSSFQHPSSSVGGTFNSQGAHFLDEDISLFDAPAFNISPLEAKAMDPQMRMLLEIVCEALENGGVTIDKIAGSKTGVYVGVFSDDYSNMVLADPESLPAHHVTGTGKAIFANRISFFFDLKGPSFALDTGCSASLVALHQACQSIRCGESQQAIVGGTNLILSPKTMMSLGGLGRGSGYGRGEGVASILIKPLKDAIAHGDPIRAIIRNTVLNQDGKTPGLTMPSREAQEALIREAYGNARLDPLDTHYVEAHGTGTKAGDPIEVEAIASLLSRSRSPSRPLVIGSVKANIGHLESASGLAGLIKAVLCLEKGQIPPSINFETENANLHLQEKCMRVARELEPWPSNSVRRASLNSFGYGGTNAHVILDADENKPSTIVIDPPPRACDTATNGVSHKEDLIACLADHMSQQKIFLISHRTRAGVLRVAKDLKEYATSSYRMADGFLDNLAYTLGTRRTLHMWRAAVSAMSHQDLVTALDAPMVEPHRSLPDQRMSFIFTGQGAQWFGMGRELIGIYQVFKSILTVSDLHFQKLGSSWSLMDELMKPAETSLVSSAAIGQPICTAIQCALVELLRSWNIKPTSVMGHSSGEIAAAYASGSLLLESALSVSYYRGLLASTRLEGNSKICGAMLAANISEADAEIFIKKIRPGRGKAVVACVNSPGNVTFAGDRTAIMSLQSMFEARQIFARRLRVGTAYHSHHMELVAASYHDALQDLPKSKPNGSVPFFSSVIGGEMRGEDLDAAYWVKNMVSQVRFFLCLQKLHYSADQERAPIPGNPKMHTLLEVGPHGALASFVKQTLGGAGEKSFQYLSTLSRGKNAIDTLLDAVSRLAVSGYPVNLQAVNNQDGKRPPRVLVDLPPYPWDHSTSHWHESRLSLDYRKRSAPRHPLLGAPTPDFNRLEPSWRNIIRVAEIPWIRGHVVQSQIVYPAAGYVAMAVEAASQSSRLDQQTDSVSGYRLSEVSITKPLIVPDDAEGIETQLFLRPYNRSARRSSDVWKEFRVFSHSKCNGWSEHCRGLISLSRFQGFSAVEADRRLTSTSARHAHTIELARTTCKKAADPARLYERFENLGLAFQGSFRCIEEVVIGAGQSLGYISIADTASVMPGGIEHPHVIHPSTLDACMQMTSPIQMESGMLQTAMVPTFIKEISIAGDMPKKPGERLLVHADTQLRSKRSFKADITASRPSAFHTELPMVEIYGLICTAIPGNDSTRSPAAGGMSHKLLWEDSSHFKSSEDTTLTNSAVSTTGQDLPPVTFIEPVYPTSASSSVVSCFVSTYGEGLVKTTSNFDDMADAGMNGRILICLAEIDGSILKTCTATQWSALQQMLSSTSRVLWVTRGGTMDVDSADAALITGLARTARSDNPGLRLITYDMNPKHASPEETVDLLLALLKRSFGNTLKSKTNVEDMEFAERSGRIYVPRIVEDANLQSHLTLQSNGPQVEMQSFFQPERSLRLEVATPGLLDSLRFVEDGSATVPLGPHELRMQPKAYGVNFRDVMIALGQLEDTSLMSSEHSGVVTEVGQALVDEYQVSDRICGWGGTAYAGSVIVSNHAVQRIPEKMSFETAASIPIVYATVYYGLVHLARLEIGESVLIHSAAGGVGQAAVMLAKHLGARIFVTVGSNEKKELMTKTYGISEDHIFSSRHLSFADGIRKLTGGRGVDVVLNSLAGESLHETFECLATLGRFIEIGKQDILANSRLDMSTFNKSVTFASVDLSIVFEQAPKLTKHMMSEVFALLASGAVQPVQPLNTFPLSDMENAFRLMQAGKHTGKVVLQANQDTIVKVYNASYILIGGLGGLGRAICRWMISRECKNIIVLSRSGLKSAHAASIKEELESKGARLAVYTCDVGDRAQLDDTLRLCSDTLPPIKGLIHSAMVIRDNTIDKLSHEDYHAALRPKVLGSLNIADALSARGKLDFFILLSSLVGIVGNNGQANYASACTFQDAFARSRTRLGMPTRSIDLGMIADAGYVAENDEVYRYLAKQGFRPVKIQELLAVLDYAISTPVKDLDDFQLMIGLTDPARQTQAINFGDAKFGYVRSAVAKTSAGTGSGESSLQLKLQDAAASAAEMHAVVREAIVAQMAKVLVVPAEDVNPSQSFSHYGGDSLSAVELRSWLARSLDAQVGVMEILSGKSIDLLAGEVLGRSQIVQRLLRPKHDRNGGG
ncbi:MAG: hypothetical protein L6R38_007574 [Xanthoria sp. 2 TBL-2021]|nr:MAG: hypothetical protein L6R38_007574 [Xanthoria sp. 2 TBL-2021]